MAINTTWSQPTLSIAAGGIDFAGGDTVSEVVLDRLVSDINRLGGTDGNAKTGPLQLSSLTQTYSNAQNTAGLTIDQSTADNEILSLKSSTDVAHGMTSITETNTYGFDRKLGGQGGREITGLNMTTIGIALVADHTTDDTAKNTSANAAVTINGQLRSGASVTSLGANANILAIKTFASTRFIFDQEGDSHEDGTGWTAYDDEDDVAVADALDRTLDPALRVRDVLRDDAATFLTENKALLSRLRIVTFNDDTDGVPFVNTSRLAMLHNGAIRQLWARLQDLERRLLPAG